MNKKNRKNKKKKTTTDNKTSKSRGHSSACNCRWCKEAKEDKKSNKTTTSNSDNKDEKKEEKKSYSFVPLPPCHEGNVKVFEKDGVTVYAGGDFRDAEPDKVDVVLDLASNVIKKRWDIPVGWDAATYIQGPKYVLDLHITDYSIPKIKDEKVPKEFWAALWEDLKAQAPVKVLAMCQGGHGRTGVVVTCLMMAAKFSVGNDNPILWLRKNYCEKAVESQSQIEYLGDMYNIPYEKESKPSYNYGGNSNLDSGYGGSGVYGGGGNYSKEENLKCYNKCDKEGGSVVYSQDIKENECDVCWNERSERNLQNCRCTNSNICKSCRDDGVKCNNTLCAEDDSYTCDDCIEDANREGDGDENEGLEIHSLTEDEYAEFEGLGITV